ncbi:MAG TPA: SDR family NAD(P)-dependent oxidoreductase, partial [Chthoniobacteraceae bacterium]|nr:SDR family NAD(P)-dependent oxidoreductase [Chthoniobacteraceae bacterium]
MNLGLQDKVMLVSGGAKGIGEAVTRSLAAEGAVACILGRNRDEADRLVTELRGGGQRADAFSCEMTDEAEVRAAVAAALLKYGRIDGVINNAGVNDKVGLRATTAEVRASLEKNVVHAFVLVQACLDALIAGRGCVVNIGTKCASTGQGGTSGYVAAKGALHA